MTSEAKNLEAIVKAIKAHDNSCPNPALKVLLNPFEFDRLGWDEIMGIPIEPHPKIPTGIIRVVCATHKAPLDELSAYEEEPEPEFEEITRPNRDRKLVPA